MYILMKNNDMHAKQAITFDSRERDLSVFSLGVRSSTDYIRKNISMHIQWGEAQSCRKYHNNIILFVENLSHISTESVFIYKRHIAVIGAAVS